MQDIHTASFIILTNIAIALSGCGGGAGDTLQATESSLLESNSETLSQASADHLDVSGATTRTTGSVTVLMTDGPTEDFDQILLTVTSVKLLGADDNQVAVFEGEKEVDLLALRNFSEVFSMNDVVPVGTYSKIRLMISKIELTTLDELGEVAEAVLAVVPANGKIDLNPRGEFTIAAGSHTVVTIDIDAEKSIKVLQAGNGHYRFRPVVFVDIESEQIEQNRLAKFEGSIQTIDSESSSFSLCGDLGNTEVCYNIRVDDQTSIFNDLPALMGFQDMVVGDHAIVNGWAQNDSGLEMDFMMLAAVVEVGAMGSFSLLSGETTAAYDSVLNSFSMDTPTLVQLMTGAQIFNQHGEVLSAEDIAINYQVNVSGIAAISEGNEPVIKATLIFVYQDEDTEEYSGITTALDVDDGRFNLITDEGSFCVVIGDEAKLILSAEDGAVAASVAMLADDLLVEIVGELNGSDCVVADTVIIFNGNESNLK